MSETTIMRFVHSNGNTDFYTEEIEELSVKTVQGIDLYNVIAKNSWSHYLIGSEYKIIDVKFYLSNQDVNDRLDEIYDLIDTYGHPEIMRFYYKYYLDSSVFIWSQMIRQGRLRHYTVGQGQIVTLPIKFIEVVPQPAEITLPTFMALEKGIGVTVSDEIIIGV